MLMEPRGKSERDSLRHRLGHTTLNLFDIHVHGEILVLKDIKPVDQPFGALEKPDWFRVVAHQIPGGVTGYSDACRLSKIQNADGLALDPVIHIEVEVTRRAGFDAKIRQKSLTQKLTG